MSMNMIRYIDDQRVEPGLIICEPMGNKAILGRRVDVGAQCESVDPDSWIPLLQSGSITLWAGDPQPTHLAALAAARDHASEAVERALSQIFG